MKEYFWNKDVFLRLGRAIPTEQPVALYGNIKYVTLRQSVPYTYVEIVSADCETLRIFIEPKEMKNLFKTLKKCLKCLEKDGGKRFLRQLRRRKQ